MKATEALRILAEVSVSQWGMFTAAQARSEGVSPLDLARLADAGHIVRLAHGVYRDAGAPGDEFEELRAVWLSTDPARTAADRVGDGAEGTVVSGATAAWLHGVGDLRPEPYEFTVARRRQTQRQELRYRVRSIPDSDVTIRSGLPVTALERTIADLVEVRTDLSLVADVLGDAMRTGRLNLDHLAALLAPLAARHELPRGDGVALRDRLMELAGVDASTLAERIATSDLGRHVALNVFAPVAEQMRSVVIAAADFSKIQNVLADCLRPHLKDMQASAVAALDVGKFQTTLMEGLKPYLEEMQAACVAAAELGRFHAELAEGVSSHNRRIESLWAPILDATIDTTSWGADTGRVRSESEVEVR